jgi:hypothetical protein
VTSATITQRAVGLRLYSLAQDATLAGGSRVFAARAGGFLVPVRVRGACRRSAATTSSADMIVITSPNVVGTPPSAAFADYIAHREADSGLCLSVGGERHLRSVRLGVVTPRRSGLPGLRARQLARARRAPRRPGHVLLLGDSSLDYKNAQSNASALTTRT